MLVRRAESQPPPTPPLPRRHQPAPPSADHAQLARPPPTRPAYSAWESAAVPPSLHTQPATQFPPPAAHLRRRRLVHPVGRQALQQLLSHGQAARLAHAGSPAAAAAAAAPAAAAHTKQDGIQGGVALRGRVQPRAAGRRYHARAAAGRGRSSCGMVLQYLLQISANPGLRGGRAGAQQGRRAVVRRVRAQARPGRFCGASGAFGCPGYTPGTVSRAIPSRCASGTASLKGRGARFRARWSSGGQEEPSPPSHPATQQPAASQAPPPAASQPPSSSQQQVQDPGPRTHLRDGDGLEARQLAHQVREAAQVAPKQGGQLAQAECRVQRPRQPPYVGERRGDSQRRRDGCRGAGSGGQGEIAPGVSGPGEEGSLRVLNGAAARSGCRPAPGEQSALLQGRHGACLGRGAGPAGGSAAGRTRKAPAYVC